MDATRSFDPDGDNLTYIWEVTSVDNSGGGATPVYNPSASGETTIMSFSNARDDTTITYTVELTVTDPAGLSDTDTVDISVTCNTTTGNTCATDSPN